jgi:hypothetical protein
MKLSGQLFGLLAFTSLSPAGILGTFSFVQYNYGPGINTNICEVHDIGCNSMGYATVPGTSASVQYGTTGIAGYGTLGASASGNVVPGLAVPPQPSPGHVSISTIAYFVDDFTFNGTGTCGVVTCVASGPGAVEFQFLVNGTGMSAGASADACLDVEPYTVSGGIVSDCNYRASLPSLPQLTPELITSRALPITFGQSSAFSISLEAVGEMSGFLDFGSPPDTWPSFQVNFLDTSTLSGFVVLDSNGNPLTSFSVTAGSGTLYPNVALPEPGNLLGAAVGLATLIHLRVRGSRVTDPPEPTPELDFPRL